MCSHAAHAHGRGRINAYQVSAFECGAVLTASRSSEENMKYEVIARATCEWAYTVEADSHEGAEAKLVSAIEEGEEGDFPSQMFDTGTLEVLGGQTSSLE